MGANDRISSRRNEDAIKSNTLNYQCFVGAPSVKELELAVAHNPGPLLQQLGHTEGLCCLFLQMNCMLEQKFLLSGSETVVLSEENEDESQPASVNFNLDLKKVQNLWIITHI